MHKGHRWLGSFSLWAALAGCAPAVSVRTASDPQVQLTRYQSFAMLEPNKPVHSNNTEVDPFVMLRLRQLTYLRLKAMGLRPTSKEQAELIVAVAASQDERVEVYPSRMYGYGYDPYFGPSMWSTQVSRTQEGIVVIDLIDRAKNTVVWRGTGVRSLEPQIDEEKMREVIDAILARFPREQSSARPAP